MYNHVVGTLACSGHVELRLWQVGQQTIIQCISLGNNNSKTLAIFNVFMETIMSILDYHVLTRPLEFKCQEATFCHPWHCSTPHGKEKFYIVNLVSSKNMLKPYILHGRSSIQREKNDRTIPNNHRNTKISATFPNNNNTTSTTFIPTSSSSCCCRSSCSCWCASNATRVLWEIPKTFFALNDTLCDEKRCLRPKQSKQPNNFFRLPRDMCT